MWNLCDGRGWHRPPDRDVARGARPRTCLRISPRKRSLPGSRLHISYVMKQADPLRPGGIGIGADRAIEMAVDGVTARGATWRSSCDRQAVEAPLRRRLFPLSARLAPGESSSRDLPVCLAGTPLPASVPRWHTSACSGLPR